MYEEASAPPYDQANGQILHYRRPYEPGCLGCLSRVPCCSLISWIIVAVGCACYVSGFYIALKYTRDLMQGWPTCPFMFWGAVGLAGITLLLVTIFLSINSCSSGETSRHYLVSRARNSGVSCCVSFSLLLAYLLEVIWTLMLCVHVIPPLIVLTTSRFRDPSLEDCIDLRYFGLRPEPGSFESLNGGLFGPNSNGTINATVAYRVLTGPRQSFHLCGRDLAIYEERSLHMLVGFCIPLIGAFMCIVGLLSFIVCLAGNFKHVKSLRHLAYMHETCDDYDQYGNGTQEEGNGMCHHHEDDGTNDQHHHHHRSRVYDHGVSAKMLN